MNYYAIEYAYGKTVINQGNRPNHLLRFETKRQRDNWIRLGHGSTGPRERATTTATQARRIARGRRWDGYYIWYTYIWYTE